jgi:hypothetical protein
VALHIFATRSHTQIDHLSFCAHIALQGDLYQSAQQYRYFSSKNAGTILWLQLYLEVVKHGMA